MREAHCQFFMVISQPSRLFSAAKLPLREYPLVDSPSPMTYPWACIHRLPSWPW